MTNSGGVAKGTAVGEMVEVGVEEGEFGIGAEEGDEEEGNGKAELEIGEDEGKGDDDGEGTGESEGEGNTTGDEDDTVGVGVMTSGNSEVSLRKVSHHKMIRMRIRNTRIMIIVR